MLSDKFLVIIAALFVGFASASDYVEVLKKKRLNRNKRALKNKNHVMDKEDVAFWTRLMQEGNVGSLPPAGGVSHDPSLIALARHVCVARDIYLSPLTTMYLTFVSNSYLTHRVAEGK
jgi:hypothetical protein